MKQTHADIPGEVVWRMNVGPSNADGWRRGREGWQACYTMVQRLTITYEGEIDEISARIYMPNPFRMRSYMAAPLHCRQPPLWRAAVPGGGGLLQRF